jgi:hypothetical protein
MAACFWMHGLHDDRLIYHTCFGYDSVASNLQLCKSPTSSKERQCSSRSLSNHLQRTMKRVHNSWNAQRSNYDARQSGICILTFFKEISNQLVRHNIGALPAHGVF